MKNTRKILLALIVVATMLVGMFTVTASAATTVAVAGSFNGWNTTANTSSTLTADGTYDVSIYLSAGTYQFKVLLNGNWYGNGQTYNDTCTGISVPNNGGDMTLVASKEGTYTFKYTSGKVLSITYTAPTCAHDWVEATCQEAKHCTKCPDVQGDPVPHYYVDGACKYCGGTTEFVTLCVDNAANWGTVYCYIWDVAPYAQWPGEEMTKGEDGRWYYDVPVNYTNVIFNNGSSSQTSDLKVPTDDKTVFNNKDKTWSAPHVHSWSDATCTEPQKCACGETQGEALGHSYESVVTAPDCTNGGYTTYTCACGDTYTDDATDALGHTFAEGTCSVCGAEDPDYVAPEVNDNVINFSTFEEYPKNTYTDGAEQIYNDIFTFYHGASSRVDGSPKEFEDGFSATLRFGFGGKWKKVDGAPGRALQINAPFAGTITLWWVAGGDGRSVDLLDSEYAVIATSGTEEVVSGGLYITTFEIPEAGVFYLTNMVDNNYWFKVEYVRAECNHVFEENTWYHPELVAATCCTPGVAVFECVNCDYYYTEEAPIDPEAHGFWGEREVITAANCKAETNGLVKVACANGCGQFEERVIDYTEAHDMEEKINNPATCTEGGEYLAVCTVCGFEEKYSSEANGHYNWYLTCGQTGTCMAEGCGVEFTLEHSGAPATCTDPMYCYNCWQSIGEPLGHTYFYNVCLVCGEANPYYVANNIVVGENKITCNQYHLVGDGQNGNHSYPYEFPFLTITEAGVYTISSSDLISIFVYTTEVLTAPEGAFATGGSGWAIYDTDGTVELEPGVYYVGFIYIAGEGEYTVNVEKQEPAHEHNFVEGKCECGAEDPDYVAPVEPDVDEPVVDEPVVEPELNFFQKIWKAIVEFFQKLLGMFSKK